jgi:photosynthesis system II assembly factor YCF48-like protein
MEQLPKIVQRRLQATAKPGVHPDADLLTAFAEKSLNQREHAQILQHLGQCTDCRSVVSLAMPEAELASSTTAAKSPWLTWPVLRWGALAACVVVVSAAVTLHYERRQSVVPVVAEKTPAPAPSANLMVERQIPNQPNEKLAAKITPPSPLFESDRAFAGKLAKQRDGADMSSAAVASALNGLRTEALKKSPAANDRLARADAVKSGDQPLRSIGQPAAGAPAPAAPPAAKAVDAEPQAGARNDNADYVARGMTETVTVESEAAPVPSMAQAVQRKAKHESPKNEARTIAGAVAALSPGEQKVDKASTETALGTYDKRTRAKTSGANTLGDKTETLPPRWTLSPEGALQRSFDSGRTWQTVPVTSKVAFRALAANDSDIWVGGVAGALYHSADAGQHWTRIKPLADGKPLMADIISIEFTDAQHGSLTTGTHETWATNDGGASWYSK